MPEILDPFTQVHQAIWNTLTNYPPWAAFVPKGARINAVPPGPLSKKPASVEPGDTPEVRINQTGFMDQPKNAYGWDVTQIFSVQMRTASENVQPLNRLKMLTMAALHLVEDNFGVPFVTGWDCPGVARESPEDPASGASAWNTVYIIRVCMFISVEQFQAQT